MEAKKFLHAQPHGLYRPSSVPVSKNYVTQPYKNDKRKEMSHFILNGCVAPTRLRE